ncbi:oxidoreductase, short chain dehydrogenase/reductase family protein [Aeromicrobium marinum DSM 15272]|uniref:Oxidoreductase, short chain dehydrogenase/reductase family protein n=1 Tax=Aeromicrobium marinum DSM 15272 TaxID=585531 RepID=E2SBX4_9ACTN|nr:SDR family oxidoreductase [Aeromicrobium marinum]EFQ83260.1 oxidoreductase, short chain dehydrogenase/reductase family protein [Aeromicrobium marinum DSM 15272]
MRRTSFDGAVTLVTGAASGIGRAAAVQAADRGARLVLTDVQAAALDEVADRLGPAVLHHAALDVADAEAVQALADHVHTLVPAVDVVMNVAGISTWGRIEDLELRHWRRTVEVDLMGPIHVMHSFVPPMVRGGRGGHLVNVSSAAGLFGLPLHAPYSAAKFGLRGISEVLRFDLEGHDIGVTLVCPGAVATPLVGTVDIVGVDRSDPRVAATVERFERHAVSPERAAAAMLRAVEKGRHLAFTSPDVRFGWYGQRYVPFGYDLVMRLANRRIRTVLRSVAPPA